jgi:hypothetical protein
MEPGKNTVCTQPREAARSSWDALQAPSYAPSDCGIRSRPSNPGAFCITQEKLCASLGPQVVEESKKFFRTGKTYCIPNP